MVTCKVLNEGTILGMEQGRWVEDDGDGAEGKRRRREDTFTCFTILTLSGPLPEAGGRQVHVLDGALHASSLHHVHPRDGMGSQFPAYFR